MSGNNQELKTSTIIGVQFSILSADEIRKNSVVQIVSRDTYINNKPVIGGLFDPRMGVLEPGLLCPTDGLTYINTPGYFGHIELARPVLFIQYLKEILKIPRCVCFNCSKLLINKNQHRHILKLPAEQRWKYVYSNAFKIKRCGDHIEDGCGHKQPDNIKIEGMAMLYAIWDNGESNTDSGNENKKIKMRLTPEILLKIFKRISDEDVFFMGFHPKWSRPDSMICQVLPVPPPAVRPSVKHDAQQRSEDDITHIYCNIIKTNNDLMNKIRENAQANVIEGITTFLQYLVAMIVNNKVKGSDPIGQRSGRPLQCITSRINSKSGRIRGNLMGKRVDFSARSVITGDPNLSMRQLGVPMKIAINLTTPELVNDRNRAFLTKLLQNGPDTYPGAKILEKRNGESISLRYVDRMSIILENGDTIHRHLMNGDAVLFNRQPSLHKMSMQCHIVKVMKQGDTFRMNVALTKNYNADFDGDEMNMHVPQSIIAQTELRILAATHTQIISPAGNSPNTGIFQDSLLGSYRFTRPNTNMSHRDAMNLLMSFKNIDMSKFKQPDSDSNSNNKKIASFEILSQILPPMTLKYKTKLFEDGEDADTSNNILEIKNGQYIRGQIEKSVFGSGTKGIIHRICNDFGNDAASDFIDNLQNIITEYMKTSSFSVGISDLISDKKTNTEIIHIINSKKTEAQAVIQEIHLGIFNNNTANTNMVEFENRVNNILNSATEQSGKVGRKSLNKQNRFLMIVNSGSKGSLINISQMISCLGQQNVDAKRIPYGFDSRTLPHYSKFDDTPNARGFIENSYIQGLTAPELFFHAMGGRIGLIDTAVKSVTGDTAIVVLENGRPIYTQIGAWIDAHIAAADPHAVQRYDNNPEKKNMELLNFTDEDTKVYIPTADAEGAMSWGQLTAITRHDPSDKLYKVTTRGGRTITVAESESLLIWNKIECEFEKRDSRDVIVGDCMPVTATLPEPPIVVNSVKMNYGHRCKFELTEENGIFVGIFLATGKIIGDHIQIVTIDTNIEEFVKKWFMRNGCVPYSDKDQLTVTACSIILSTFFKNWIGDGTCGQVPADAFVANMAFIRGVLNGYFSGAGTDTKTAIIAKAASRQMLEGIAMLCSRLGIFCKIFDDYDMYMDCMIDCLSISGHWAAIFTNKIKLLNSHMNKFLQNTVFQDTRCGDFAQQHDVVLDAITAIEVITADKHAKLYDVTVPSTLNFGCANGVICRDTSSTGYIQRRLIKGLEDLKVEYDHTVRNSKGKIVQFAYGEDGFESTKVENQNLPLVEMKIEDVYMHYEIAGVTGKDTDLKLTNIYDSATIKRLKNQTELAVCKNKCKEYISKMITARDQIVRAVFKYKNENSIRMPIAFQALILNIQGNLGITASSFVDITPLEAFTLIEEYFEKLKTIYFVKPTDLFEVMYFFHLSPKDLLISKRFHRKALVLLLETVVLKYKQSIVHPGEMVGVIAGQSLGEPITQLTLNTFHNSGTSSKSNVTRGVPRIEEILRLTENPKIPSLTVHLKEFDEEEQDKAAVYANMLEHTRLVDLVKNVQICFDPNDHATLIPEDAALLEQFYEFERIVDECMDEDDIAGGSRQIKSKWIVRITFDIEMMLDKNITMDDIHFAIKNTSYGNEVKCVFSDYNMDKLIFRIRVNSSVFSKSSKKKPESLDPTDEIYLLRNFQDSVLNNIVLRGINGIRNVIPRKLQNMVVGIGGKEEKGKDGMVIRSEGQFVKKDVYVLDTTGSNLLDVLGLDFIDYRRTYSNDIREVFDVLGIEATRQIIYNEFVNVMEFQDVYINYHHLSILADRMTNTKELVPIYRSGILNDDIGPISKSTFEVHTEVLLNAARHAEFDHMRGVSANVMMGQRGYYGTNAFGLVLDLEKMSKIDTATAAALEAEREKTMQIDSMEDAFKLEATSECSRQRLDINNNITNIKYDNLVVCEDDDNYDMW